MKKFGKRLLQIFGVLVLVWLVMAQSCMSFRMTDKDAVKTFSEKGIPITLSTFTIQNRHIHFAKVGSDTLPTLFFMHGSPGSWNAYEQYMKDKQLLQHFRIVSIDRPGFGDSDYGDAISLEKQTLLLKPLLDTLQNHKPFYLIGHSLGGPLAVMLGANYPEYISGLVLLAASVDPNEEKAEDWRPVLKSFPLKYFVPGAFRPSNIELWAFKKDVLRMPADLHKVKCPVIIIHGLLDPLVPPGNAYYAKKELTKAASVQLITIKGANHFIPWTKYEIIKKALLSLDNVETNKTDLIEY